jgi:solute carrier family 6 amino acid transporter-like protein 5/7/9/14
MYVISNYMLGKSSGIDDLSAMQWKLFLALLVAWIIVVGALIKGIKTSGKVVYFTATFPYVILIVLFVRGITLDGAFDGINR